MEPAETKQDALASTQAGTIEDHRPRLLKVVIVSQAPFASNSGGHVAGFAAGLAALGHATVVCASEVLGAYSFGPPPYAYFDLRVLTDDPQAVLAFDGRFQPSETVLLAWTPRTQVRRAVAALASRYGVPYVVHMEDNEGHLAATRAQADDAGEGASSAEFIASAAGATLIEARLQEFLPPALKSIWLEPGVDSELLGTALDPVRRSGLRLAVGAPAGACLVLYPGNVHLANFDEVAELYRAIALVRGRRRNVVLIRTGTDHVSVEQTRWLNAAEGVRSLGYVDRRLLLELLRSADLFVQPGRPGPFNDYRLPSKLPEFMAAGKPILLPYANVGVRLRHGVDAMVLQTGSAEEIAARVAEVMDDPALARRLGQNAQTFARRTYQWPRQAQKLSGFLSAIARDQQVRQSP